MPPNCLAGLDTVVQIAAGRPILSASVAFVALSGEAEYAYAWLFASVVTRGVAPPENRRLRNEDVMAGFQPRFFREPPATPPAEVAGSGIVRVVKGYKELASVTDDFGRD